MVQIYVQSPTGVQAVEAATGAEVRALFPGQKVVLASEELAAEQLVKVEDNEDLLGGGKKRKKKTYTKPKKVKRKHKKVKLAVLKFYKVEGDSKVTRLRRACPQCGPG